MDILDEVDAAVHEKKSKWNYTPMREKSETDAIIDELLREFSPAGRTSARASVNTNKAEKEPAIAPESQPERMPERVPEKMPEPKPEEAPAAVPDNTGYISVSQLNEELREQEQAAAQVKPEKSPVRPSSSSSNDEYNEYMSQKYSQVQAEPEPEYEAESGNDNENSYTESDGYDDYDDEFDDEYDDEYNDDSESDNDNNNNNDQIYTGADSTGMDFNSFMDSENEGQKGDIKVFSFSAILKIILKIVVLAAFGAFAVVGIINTADIINEKYFSSDEKDTNSMKQQLGSVIYPLIATETDDFKSPSEISQEQLINISVWEIVINGNKSVFENKDTGEHAVPQDQVTYIVNKLFGEGIKLSHTSTEISGRKVTYDKKNKQYILPEDTDLYTYYPEVTDISENGSDITVYADCYSSVPSWNSGKSDPVKRVVLDLTKTNEYYNIKSLKTVPVE